MAENDAALEPRPGAQPEEPRLTREQEQALLSALAEASEQNRREASLRHAADEGWDGGSMEWMRDWGPRFYKVLLAALVLLFAVLFLVTRD